MFSFCRYRIIFLLFPNVLAYANFSVNPEQNYLENSSVEDDYSLKYRSDENKKDFVDEWFSSLDYRLGQMNSAGSSLQWRGATNPGPEVTRLTRKLGMVRTAWRNSWCAQTKEMMGDFSLLSESQLRQVYLMCRGLKFTPHQAKEMSEILGKLEDIYSSARVCRRHGESCYSGEPDLERLMRHSRDPAELLWAWQEWRRSVGPRSKPLFAALVELQNQGARNNGYRDAGEVWREELETSHLEEIVEELYESVEPLYVLLHAVVRHRLVQFYGEENVNPRGPIPAHLLGNMWAQNWESLLDIILPNSDTNLGDALRKRKYTPWDMARKSEDFYTSLGLDPMTPTFWAKSQMSWSNANGTCHGTAANMYTPGDYRMLLCAEVSEEDFYVIHHEMGHIEYYMAYRHQPFIFQDGANSAFHESVGDSIMYGVMAPQHLQRLGLINDSDSSKEEHIVFLLRQALSKIPQIPFGLIIDKWRWAVFRGQVKPHDYNAAWWQLRTQYQGIAPPVARGEDDFDPAAKFHIPDNTPYVRYYLSSFLQVQMFQAMCEIAVLGKVNKGPLPIPLHQCDIYGSKPAGKKLRAMMSLGCSKPWQDVLEVLTGTRHYDPKPLLKYYAPLYTWLLEQIRENNIAVGWD